VLGHSYLRGDIFLEYIFREVLHWIEIVLWCAGRKGLVTTLLQLKPIATGDITKIPWSWGESWWALFCFRPECLWWLAAGNRRRTLGVICKLDQVSAGIV